MEAGGNYELTDYVDLVSLLQDLVSRIEPEADAKGISVSISSDLDEIVLPANQELLRRALENILRNAIQHTPNGKTISAQIINRSHQCEIRVRDGGMGIEEEKLRTIFEPFYRADNSRSPSGGYGLGLAIAQRAIHLHHGTVGAQNHPDGGLEIRLLLPLGDLK